MRLKIFLSLFVMLPFVGCVSDYPLQAEPQALTAEHRISNAVLSLGICMRDAGAVCSIVYDGHEFVNDFDHGRQMQVAWSYSDLGEAYNPTEAGSADDFTKPTSTSELLSVRVDGSTLTTESHPAYWQRVGAGRNKTQEMTRNTQTVTKDTLKKTLTLGYGGDPHVIVLDAAVTVSPELTGPPITKMLIEVPAFYTSRALTEHYQFDRHDGAMVKIIAPVDRTNKRMLIGSGRQRIPILSSPDGQYAVGVYTPQSENFWQYRSYSFPSSDPMNACHKAAVHFLNAAEAGKTYSYRTFVIIGDLETVKNAAMKLP